MIARDTSKALAIVDTQMTREDYRSLVMRLSFRRPIIVAVVIVCLLNIFIAFFDAYSHGEFTTANILGSWNFIIGIILLLVYPLLILFRTNHMYKSSKQLIKPTHYEFYEDRIYISTENSESSTAWENIYHVLELEDWLLIYVNMYSAYMIRRIDFNPVEYIYVINSISDKKFKKKLLKRKN